MSSKGKKKDGGGGKAAAEEVEPDEEEKELIERELVISYLKSKLGRYQLQGEKLQVENIKLSEELDSQKASLKDINEFLTNELKARSVTTTALEENIAGLEERLDQQKTQYEAIILKLKDEKAQVLQKMDSSIHDYEKKTRGIQEFLDKKELLESELAELKETLENTRQDYERRIGDMERQHIQDKEKWKREMVQKIRETKTYMMKLTDNQLEITTKRTIMENEQMSSELAYQSRQTEKLLQKNKQLHNENADMRRQMELARQTQEELAKRNFVYQKTIGTLLTKLKNSAVRKGEDENVMMDLNCQVAELQEQLRISSLNLQDHQEQIGQLTSDCQVKAHEVRDVKKKYDTAANFLVQCMEDVKKKIVTVVSEDRHGSDRPEIMVLPGRLEDLSLEQRQRALEYLLGKFYMQFRPDLEEVLEPPSDIEKQSSGSIQLPHIGAENATWELNGSTACQNMAWPARAYGYQQPQLESHSHLSTGVQTQPIGLERVEDVSEALMSNVRPWGLKASNLQSSVRGSDTFLRRSVRGGKESY